MIDVLSFGFGLATGLAAGWGTVVYWFTRDNCQNCGGTIWGGKVMVKCQDPPEHFHPWHKRCVVEAHARGWMKE